MVITSTEAQNNFGKYLKYSQYEDVAITKNGRKIAVIKACTQDEFGNTVVKEQAEEYGETYGEKYGEKKQKMTYEEFSGIFGKQRKPIRVYRRRNLSSGIAFICSPVCCWGNICLHVPVVQREKMQADGGAF